MKTVSAETELYLKCLEVELNTIREFAEEVGKCDAATKDQAIRKLLQLIDDVSQRRTVFAVKIKDLIDKAHL